MEPLKDWYTPHTPANTSKTVVGAVLAVEKKKTILLIIK